MAALAAGVATSMAQNVYSLNIVGYANVPCNTGFHFYSNPFSSGVTNGANEVFDNSGGQWNACEIQSFNGVGFDVVVFDNDPGDTTTGFTNGDGSQMRPAPLLTGGKGFVFNNTSASNNIVFVGQVRLGTNTTTFAANDPVSKAIGSPLPYAGTVTSLGFTNLDGHLNACSLIELKTTIPGNGGASAGFKVSVWDNDPGDSTTGFTNSDGSQAVPEPVFPMAAGFLFNNPNNTAVVWTQILNNP